MDLCIAKTCYMSVKHLDQEKCYKILFGTFYTKMGLVDFYFIK